MDRDFGLEPESGGCDWVVVVCLLIGGLCIESMKLAVLAGDFRDM